MDTCGSLCTLLIAVQVNMHVTCHFVRDVLWGDDVTELRLKLTSQGAESFPFKNDD